MHWWEHPNCDAPPTWNPIFSQFGPLYYLQCAFWTLCPAGCQTLAAQQDTQANCSGRNWIGGGGGIPASSRITWAKTQPKAKEGPKCAQDLWLMVLCFCGCAGIGGWGGGYDQLLGSCGAIKYNQTDCLFLYASAASRQRWPIMRFWFFINFLICN